jgi:hypothetical protein
MTGGRQIMADTITNTADIIDSRDIIERIEDLESSVLPFRASLVYNDGETPTESEDFATIGEAHDYLCDLATDCASDDGAALFSKLCEAFDGNLLAVAAGPLHADIIANPDVDEDEVEELRTLKAFAEEGENYSSDWNYGATLIREGYFTQYAEELVKDIADLPRDIPSYIAIDWEKTAENLKVDYTPIEFDGETYLVR